LLTAEDNIPRLFYMSTQNKKNRERALLDEFLAETGLYSGAEIIEYEHPDFILKQTALSIGVEMTEYFQGKRSSGGSEMRKAEAICEGLRTRLRDALRSGPDKVALEHRSALLRFKTHGAVLGGDEPAFITQFGSLIKANTSEVKFEHYDLGAYPMLENRLQRIMINRARGLLMEEPWGCVECGAGAVGITEDELISALKCKAGLGTSYKASANVAKIVLLICAAGGVRLSESTGAGGNIDDLITKVRPLMSKLEFDEIYFYSRDGDWARRLFP